MRLTNYVIKKKLREMISRQTNRQHTFKSLEDVQDVLVLFHYYDREKVNTCLDQLKAMGKTLRTCVYLPQSVQVEPDTYDVIVSSKHDLNLWGVPSEKICSQAGKLKADVLIDLTALNCYAMKYIGLLHPATFKVGLKWDDHDSYDLSITVTDTADIAYLFGQILFYLQTIRSK